MAWQVALIANGVISVSLLTASWSSFRERRLRLAFLLLAVGLLHSLHVLTFAMPTTQVDARALFADWRLYVAEVVVAAAALAFIATQLHRQSREQIADLEARLMRGQASAVLLHDGVVQRLAAAKLALELGRLDDAAPALDQALEEAKRTSTKISESPW